MYIHESFQTSAERNARCTELKQEHYDVVKYSEPEKKNEQGSYSQVYIVAYPVNERLYE